MKLFDRKFLSCWRWIALVACALVWTTAQTSSQFSETIANIRSILLAEQAGLRSGFNLPMSDD